MSRHRTKPEDIRKPEHYFNSYIAKEVKREQVATTEYYGFFDSLDEAFPYGLGDVEKGSQPESFEQDLAGSSLFAWIDQIEDGSLFAAVQSLTERQKVLLSLRYQFCLSQKDISLVMGITQQMVSASEKRILSKIKKFLK